MNPILSNYLIIIIFLNYTIFPSYYHKNQAIQKALKFHSKLSMIHADCHNYQVITYYNRSSDTENVKTKYSTTFIDIAKDMIPVC